MLEMEKIFREKGKTSLIILSNTVDELLENLLPPKEMEGINGGVFEEASEISQSILEKLDPRLKYHCKEHTLMVTKVAIDIAINEGLSISECYLVGIYALFHDTGFTKQYNANEGIGADALINYAKNSKYNISPTAIGIGINTIINTNMQKEPNTIYAQILRDADFAILAHNDFMEWNEKLRQELLEYPEATMHETAKDIERWKKSQYEFLSEHHKWFTQSAETMYEDKKQENLKKFLN